MYNLTDFNLFKGAECNIWAPITAHVLTLTLMSLNVIKNAVKSASYHLTRS